MKQERQLLGTSAAARELHRSEQTIRASEQTIRAMADHGLLPSVRDCSGRRVFTRADVLRVKAELAAKQNSEFG